MNFIRLTRRVGFGPATPSGGHGPRIQISSAMRAIEQLILI